MAEQLAAHATVLYVEPPRSPLTRLRRHGHVGHADAPERGWTPRITSASATLLRMTPLAPPGKERPGIHLLTEVAQRWWIAAAIRTIGLPVHSIIAGTLDPVLGRLRAPRSVLYATDDYVAGAALMGVPTKRLRQREARAAADADLVIACSQVLADHWAGRGQQVHVVPNGVDAALFGRTPLAAPASDVGLPRPVAGVMGRLSKRIDVGLLEAVHAKGWSLLLVGSRPGHADDPRLERFLTLPRVRWVGPRAFEELPRYLRHVDVGLVPYADTAFNRASFPLKTLEYLAAGLPVVATALPAIESLGSPYVSTVRTAEDFADAVEQHRPRGDGPDPLAAARMAFAARHSWHARGTAVAELLGLHPAGQPPT